MKKKYWTVEESIEEAKKIGIEVSRPTLIKWINEYKLGFQLGGKGGKWYTYPQRYMRYINGGRTQAAQDLYSDSGDTTGGAQIPGNSDEGKKEQEIPSS